MFPSRFVRAKSFRAQTNKRASDDAWLVQAQRDTVYQMIHSPVCFLINAVGFGRNLEPTRCHTNRVDLESSAIAIILLLQVFFIEMINRVRCVQVSVCVCDLGAETNWVCCLLLLGFSALRLAEEKPSRCFCQETVRLVSVCIRYAHKRARLLNQCMKKTRALNMKGVCQRVSHQSELLFAPKHFMLLISDFKLNVCLHVAESICTICSIYWWRLRVRVCSVLFSIATYG